MYHVTTQKILQEAGEEIRFIRAVEEGCMCWFYLRLHADKRAEYEQAVQSGAVDIRAYGDILESDLGQYPPMDVMRFMQEEYGFETPENAQQ